MTCHRDPYIQFTIPDTQLENQNSDEEDESLLKEIFEVSTEMMIPPCYLKRSTTSEEEWEPVVTKMTPMSDSIGMTVDSTPTA